MVAIAVVGKVFLFVVVGVVVLTVEEVMVVEVMKDVMEVIKEVVVVEEEIDPLVHWSISSFITADELK